MYGRQIYTAYLLLVLFLRVLAPEAAVLSLHRHTHTEDVLQAGQTVGQAHIHCHVDDLFNKPFLSSCFSLELCLMPPAGCYVQPYDFAWKFTYPNNTYLRGPPVA
ncbi:hypothetical protein C1N53_04075 [Pontibacter sp. SGAir0037]|nr:hypothetical protein C1N53_04075 [Pontibacter sp. SGAir0037]